MLRLICNNRGIGLIEVVIAIFLVSFGVLTILSMQPSAWKLVGKSDYLGRAAGILHKELEIRETCVMNSCIPLATCRNSANYPANYLVYASGVAAGVSDAGDAQYTVTTVINDVTAPDPPGVTVTNVKVYQVQVTVTWRDPMVPGFRNLVESAIVSLQGPYSYDPAYDINRPRSCVSVR
jgi:Tfp pilus assembly protein PilV